MTEQRGVNGREMDSVSVTNSALKELHATTVRAESSAFALVRGEKLSLRGSSVGAALAEGELQLVQGGGLIVAAAHDLSVIQGGGSVVAAGNDLSVHQGGGWLLAAGNRASIERGGSVLVAAGGPVSIQKGVVGLLLAGNVNLQEEARVLLGTRQVLALGAALGVAFALTSRLLRR